MSCPFVAQFLARLDVDLNRASINFDLLEKVAAFKQVDLKEDQLPTRMAWAIVSCLRALAEPSIVPPPARSWALTADFLEEALAGLEPLKKAPTIAVTEIHILDERDAQLRKKREHESDLRQLQRLERLILSVKACDFVQAANHFYDFVYRLCQDTEAVPAWAERLMEIR